MISREECNQSCPIIDYCRDPESLIRPYMKYYVELARQVMVDNSLIAEVLAGTTDPDTRQDVESLFIESQRELKSLEANMREAEANFKPVTVPAQELIAQCPTKQPMQLKLGGLTIQVCASLAVEGDVRLANHRLM